MSKDSLMAIREAILSALDVMSAASESSQRHLNARREHWSYNNTASACAENVESTKTDAKPTVMTERNSGN